MKLTYDGARPTHVPTVMCLLCGAWLEVVPHGRGFPPDIAKRRLTKDCLRRGHDAEPHYRAGFTGRAPQGQGS